MYRGINRHFNKQINLKRIRIFPIHLSKIFWFFKDVYEKGLMPYWREGIYDQLLWSIRESLWNIFNMVNKSVKYWTSKTGKNVPSPPKPISLGLESENLKIWFQILKLLRTILNLLTKCLCIMDYTLFQTSSRGSELKQNRFGGKIRNTVKMQS